MTETTITEKKLILCPAEQKEGQNNRSRLWDFFFLLLFQAAWTGTLGSMFQLDFFWLLPTVGRFFSAFRCCFRKKKGKNRKKKYFFGQAHFCFLQQFLCSADFFWKDGI